ncbi:unnamed protein product [Malus baccata var. baccata]
MDSDAEALEEKLVSLLGQLQAEAAILERKVYKNKNQHRRGSYFQHLMKVYGFPTFLKKRKCESGKHNFMERLLGAARLLSQMVEAMLKAAFEISTLLARSFFMGFSLTVLALLARLRVLVQQILLDVISVFNMVSSLCQKQQSVRIVQGGLEVFREFYPINEEIIILECAWKSDKFELIERTHKTEMEVKEDKINLMSGLSNDGDNRQLVERCQDGTTVGETPSMKFSEEGCLLTGTRSSSSSDASKLKSGPVKVAFIQVKTPSQSNTTEIPSKETDINSNY